jgi:hypothetical protein
MNILRLYLPLIRWSPRRCACSPPGVAEMEDDPELQRAILTSMGMVASPPAGPPVVPAGPALSARSARSALREDQDAAYRESCEEYMNRVGPAAPALPPIEPTVDCLPVRLKLPTGEVVVRRFLLEEPLGMSVVQFLQFKQQSRQPWKLGIRDGTRMRWLDLEQSSQQQGVLPMDMLVCWPAA